jgi:hypothetical protein
MPRNPSHRAHSRQAARRANLPPRADLEFRHADTHLFGMGWVRSILRNGRSQPAKPVANEAGIRPIAPDILDRNPLSYADPPDLVNRAKLQDAIARSWRHFGVRIR